MTLSGRRSSASFSVTMSGALRGLGLLKTSNPEPYKPYKRSGFRDFGNPKLLNPKPQHPKPLTLNPQPLTLNQGFELGLVRCHDSRFSGRAHLFKLGLEAE